MKPIALHLDDLAVPFGEAPGLHGINLNVAAAERLVLLGASGAGKTTLLRAVAGLTPITQGRIRVGGRDVTAVAAESRDAVYLHQTPLLFPHLDVFENVAFPLRIRRVPDPRVRAQVAELLRSVRLEDMADRRPHTLSGGQKHRAALARAMAARPAVLLLDEPLTALDPMLRDEVRATLFLLQAEHQPALVIVTHDLEDAAALGNRIGILLEGTLAQVDSPEVLFRRPATLPVARFLGIPNLVPGSVEAGRFLSVLGCLPAGEGLPAGPAVAAFGPDALYPDPGGSVRGTVRGIQHRARGATMRVAVGALELEATPPIGASPAQGSELSLAVALDRVTILSGRDGV